MKLLGWVAFGFVVFILLAGMAWAVGVLLFWSMRCFGGGCG